MGCGVGFQNLVCSGSPGAPSLKLSFKNLFLHASGQVVLSKEAQQILPILEKKNAKKPEKPQSGQSIPNCLSQSLDQEELEISY